MILENIEYSDKYNLIKLTVSGENFFIDYDMYYENNFQIEDELDFDLYKKILACDEYNRAKNFALNKISYSQKSTYEIRQKLKEKKFSDDSIDKVIEFLDSYGFLDDKSYVRSFVNDKDQLAKWSKKKIAFMLKRKHIDDNLVEEFVSQINQDREIEKASFFADKKIRDDYSFENRQKVFRHLVGKGFEIDVINIVLDERFK